MYAWTKLVKNNIVIITYFKGNYSNWQLFNFVGTKQQI